MEAPYLRQSCIELAFLYGCESWSLRQQHLLRLVVTQRKTMRKMVGVTLLDRRTNEWLTNIAKLQDIRARATRKKWNWRQHAHMSPERWTLRLVEWRLQFTRPMGRPTKKMESSIQETARKSLDTNGKM